jgi:hypothetical protein
LNKIKAPFLAFAKKALCIRFACLFCVFSVAYDQYERYDEYDDQIDKHQRFDDIIAHQIHAGIELVKNI